MKKILPYLKPLLLAFLVVMVIFSSSGFAQVSFTVDTASGCPPFTVNFTNTSTAGDAFYWDFGDGNDDFNLNSSNTFTQPGIFTVELIGLDTTGSGGNPQFFTPVGTFEMDMMSWGIAQVLAGVDSACPNEEVPFYINAAGTAFEWDFDDGNSSTDQYPSHAFTNPGLYNVRVIVSNPCGADTAFTPVVIDNGTTPDPNMGIYPDTATGCPGDPFSFYYEGPNIPTYQVEWDFGDGSSTASGFQVQHTFADTGVYTVTQTITNLCGNAASESDTVFITNDMILPEVDLFGFPACPGDDIFAVIVSEGEGDPVFAEYSWDFGDGNTDSVANPVYAYSDTGTYLLSVIITNGCGVSDTLSTEMIVGDNLPVNIQEGTFGIPEEESEYCPGDSVLFFYSGTGSAFWDFGDGNSAPATDSFFVAENGGFWVDIVMYAYADTGTYTATVTISNGCGNSAMDSIMVYVTDSSEVNGDFVWAVPSGGGNYQACEEVEFVALGGAIYEWDFGDGDTMSTSSSSVFHTYTDPGMYDIALTVTNGCGNSVLVDKMIQIEGMEPALVSEDAVCNGDSNGSVMVTPSGGVGPFSFSWDNGATTKDLSSVPAGIYILTVSDANGCEIMDTVEVSEPDPLVVDLSSSDVSCNGEDDGSAMVSVSGGTSPYTYLWQDNSTTASISGLSAGSYGVTVTDVQGCEMKNTALISEPAPLSVSMQTTSASCALCNTGSATTTVSGGTAPYSYLWDAGDTTSDITNVLPGTYTVLITDANGCTAEATDSVDFINAVESVISTPGIRIFPNPAVDRVYIQFEKPGVVSSTIRLYTPSGKSVSRILCHSRNCELSLSDLPSGLYFIRIEHAGKSYFHKVLVE